MEAEWSRGRCQATIKAKQQHWLTRESQGARLTLGSCPESGQDGPAFTLPHRSVKASQPKKRHAGRRGRLQRGQSLKGLKARVLGTKVPGLIHNYEQSPM